LDPPAAALDWRAESPSAASPGPALALRLAGPNPFRDGTTVSFSLSDGARVQADIHDVTGRRLRSLLDQVLPAGHHDIPWDGRSGAGKHVAPGVYFVRVDALGRTVTRRVVAR
jgi:hypothetical protein